ncbi:PTS sugar transporter subunit IIC [Carnobacterium gallinarum]|uniref:PTS sugar transporter subunit IIC n=1 Tax=Carnobacterium gallinarum TaxID=2749 RepID=UPI0005560AF9|nr:PTS sugar transporter subunit IIC [Carnobacterium gallinarum]
MNSKLIEKLSIYSTKIASQKHIMAIRDAFATTIPITIVAAFFLLVNNVLLNQDTGLLRSMPGVDFISAVGVQAYNGTLGILGLLVTFLIGYRLAKSYDMEGSLEAIIAVACYVSLVPNAVSVWTADGDVTTMGALTQNYTSASGMFLGIIASLLSVSLLGKLSKSKKLRINMPDSVPPAIAKSFNLLIPSFLTISIFAIAEEAIKGLSGMTVPDLVVKVLQTPLVGGFQTLPGILLYVFLATFVFIFGIHGAFVFGAISGPILLASLQQNIDAIKAGVTAPNIVTQPFLDAYVYMGGGGTMICLVIALLIFSKKDEQRLIAKLGTVPSLFNISEPIMFGLPIVFNPIYAVPFVIVPMVSTIIAYVATSLQWVPPTYILVPWVTPPILSGYLATAGDFRASLLQIVIIIIGVVIYTPFVLISNRVKEA